MAMRELRTALLMLLALTGLTGIAYPLVVTGIAQLVFPGPANGSLVMDGEVARGSALIAQPFDDPRYFWSRPSATGGFPNNGAASSGSNMGPTNDALVEAVKGRVDALRAADPGNTARVPVDLITASSSGLDPHISPAAAHFQAGRVARERGLPPAEVESLIRDHTQGRWLGLFGEPGVNVLLLNLALDRLAAR
jgi:potassium-transporting ATPase KdpC subunit